MAVITDFVEGMQAHQVLGGYQGYLYNEIDFSVKNCVATNEVQVLKVNAEMVVYDFTVEIITPEGGVATGDFGDGDDPNGFDDGVDLNAAAGTFTGSVKGTDAYAHGVRYAADDTIDLTLDNDCDTAKIKVWAKYMRLK